MAGQRVVGRFEILRELGRGGMAVVYVARQTELDREVALKELARLHDPDFGLAERFVREARVAGSLSHPNVVTVFDFFREAETPYIAMEYLARGSLRPLVGRLSLPQTVGVLEGLLAGLAHAERRGIVHRDLKPENLLVTDDGEVKIADFGISKALNVVWTMGSLTAPGMAIGTPTYMAPEQATAKDVGPWTDLYATGVIAYELLAGRPPFAGGDTPMAILWKHVNDPIPPLREANPEVDPRLAAWVEWLLEKEPGERPAGARQAWDTLEEIVEELCGPRWRRDARLVEAPEEEPLPPARFRDTPPEPPPAEAPPPPPEATTAPSVPPEPTPPAAPAPPPPALPPPELVPAPPPAEPSFEFPAPEPQRRVSPPVLAAVAIAAALALAAGLFFLLRGNGSSNGEAGPKTTPSGPRDRLAGLAWTRQELPAAGFAGPDDQEMAAVAGFSDGTALAVGYDGLHEAAWRLDGGTWVRDAGLSAVAAHAGQMNAVVGARGVDVAVGFQNLQPFGLFGTVWTLAGESWNVPCIGDCEPSGPGGVSETIYGVAAGPAEFVAVGRALVDGHFDAAVWLSDNGTDWRHGAPNKLVLGGDGDQVMKAVASTPLGFVAVGRDRLDAAVWTSRTGRAWTRIRSPSFGGAGAQEMNGIAFGRGALVAAGTDAATGQNDVAVWRSTDGERWTRVSSDSFGGRGGQKVTGAAAVPGGFVVVGYDNSVDGGDVAIWTSPDGLHWRRMRADAFAGAGVQEADAVAFVPGIGLVAVGDATSPGGGDQDAAVWVAPLAVR